MRLSELLQALPPAHRPLRVEGGEDPVIRGLAYDSRAVAAGDLFFALPGSRFDGHAYLEQALALGAAAVAVEQLPPDLDLGGRPALLLRDTRRALAPAAAFFFGSPSSELQLVGVTGTNGKTSVCYLLESILAKSGRRVGVIGTVETRFAGERQRALNTTPESLELQRTLRAMCTRNVDVAVMEVSSHGLELGRVEGCRFALGAFTNLSQDHLDFHGDMDSYRRAKARLFDQHLEPGAHAVVNVDDPYGAFFVEAARKAGARVLRVARSAEAEVRLEQSEVRLSGTRARLALPDGPLEVDCPLVGDFNLENLLVAAGAAVALGLQRKELAEGIAACPQVPGRVERIGGEDPRAPTVLVDYAHTPDAVEKLLRTLRPLSRGRLVTVFGCGGDRDRGKRPLMAEAVARYSDRAVATSDNPRHEDPLQILADVERGLGALRRAAPEDLAATESGYSVLSDRRAAIELAIRIAESGDTVVLAGKGHEDYQIVGDERLPFSDCEEALRALRSREAS